MNPMHNPRLVWINFVLLISMPCFSQVASQPNAGPNGKPVKSQGTGRKPGVSLVQPTSLQEPKKDSQHESALVIKLRASREQPSAGSDFGISADIENISDKPVYLNSRWFTMTAPPELDADGPKDWYAWLPGTNAETSTVPPPSTAARNFDKVVVITPHSKMSAFWSGNLQNTNKQKSRFDSLCVIFGEDCGVLFRNVSFPPGKYTINVVGSYWDTSEGARDNTIDHRTEIAAIEVPIVAAQATILFGAALGGLFAFLLIPNRKASTSSSWVKRTIGVAGSIITSVLLSVIVTILLARLAESQFLIKISINDFWGAIAVGFIASASGTGVLKRFTNALGAGTANEQPKAQPKIQTAIFKGSLPRKEQDEAQLAEVQNNAVEEKVVHQD